MAENEAVEYHRRRATRELHLGLETACAAAARSHLKLSALHFKRLRQLERRCSGTTEESADVSG